MSTILAQAWPRAGLGGNPSDGYGGRTLAFTFDAFAARVWIEPARTITVGEMRATDLPNARRRWPLEGYGRGMRLLPATVCAFARELEIDGLTAPAEGFTMNWETDIPRGVGLAGSSGLIIAALRALSMWAGARLETLRMAGLALAIEVDELGITAGPQDRVVQSMEGLVYMDFGRDQDGSGGPGAHVRVPANLLPPAFVAWDPRHSADSSVYHSDLRERYDAGDPAVRAAIRRWADIALAMRSALETGERQRVCDLVDENFDLRRAVSRVGEGDVALVEAIRSAGAAAKQAGSGGAIVGLMRDDRSIEDIREAVKEVGAEFRLARPVG